MISTDLLVCEAKSEHSQKVLEQFGVEFLAQLHMGIGGVEDLVSLGDNLTAQLCFSFKRVSCPV